MEERERASWGPWQQTTPSSRLVFVLVGARGKKRWQQSSPPGQVIMKDFSSRSRRDAPPWQLISLSYGTVFTFASTTCKECERVLTDVLPTKFNLSTWLVSCIAVDLVILERMIVSQCNGTRLSTRSPIKFIHTSYVNDHSTAYFDVNHGLQGPSIVGSKTIVWNRTVLMMDIIQ